MFRSFYDRRRSTVGNGLLLKLLHTHSDKKPAAFSFLFFFLLKVNTLNMLICLWNKSIYVSLKVSSASVVTHKLLLGLFTGVLFRFFFLICFSFIRPKNDGERNQKRYGQIRSLKGRTTALSILIAPFLPITQSMRSHFIAVLSISKHKDNHQSISALGLFLRMANDVKSCEATSELWNTEWAQLRTVLKVGNFRKKSTEPTCWEVDARFPKNDLFPADAFERDNIFALKYSLCLICRVTLECTLANASHVNILVSFWIKI